MRRALGLLVLAALGCGSPKPCVRDESPRFPSVDAGLPFDPDGGFPTAPPLPLVGTPIRQGLAASSFPLANCEGEVAKVTVTTSVLDPSNQPLEHTHAESSDTVTVITFTPPKPGPYHLTARFEPGLGDSQVDLMVAVDRADAGATPVTFSDASANTVERLDDGTVLWSLGVSNLVIRSVRGGELQNLSASNFARVGKVLWIITPNSLRRLTYDATTGFFVQGPSVTSPFPGLSGLTATEDFAWVASSTQGMIAKFDGTALTLSNIVNFASPLGNVMSTALSLDAGVVAAAGAEQFCQLDTATLLHQTCFGGLGPPVGHEPGMLWTFSAATRALRQLTVGATHDAPPKAALLTLPFGYRATPVTLGGAISGIPLGVVPVVTGGQATYVPRRDGDTLVLERFSDPARLITFTSTVTQVRACKPNSADCVLLKRE